MMGPTAIDSAAGQMTTLLDLVGDPKKYKAQVDNLTKLAKTAQDAQAQADAATAEQKKIADKANSDRLAAETAKAAAESAQREANDAKAAANKTLADAQALKSQVDAEKGVLGLAQAQHRQNVLELAIRSDQLAKKEQDAANAQSLAEAKAKELSDKIARLKEITG
jgi:hypothetical protein